MRAPIRFPLAMLATCVLALTACDNGGHNGGNNGVDNDGTRLDVVADAQVSAAPDVAQISAGVVAIAPTAGEALKANAAAMNALFTAVKTQGIAEKDIQTSNFSINPQYTYAENQAPRIQGYEARNTVTLKVRDLDKIGPMLDLLVTSGANDVNGPNFVIDNDAELLNEARKQAIAKAKAQADIYAQATGLKVKRIISISESASSPPVRPMMMAKMAYAEAADASTPVAAGEMNVNLTVSIAYELE